MGWRTFSKCCQCLALTCLRWPNVARNAVDFTSSTGVAQLRTHAAVSPVQSTHTSTSGLTLSARPHYPAERCWHQPVMQLHPPPPDTTAPCVQVNNDDRGSLQRTLTPSADRLIFTNPTQFMSSVWCQNPTFRNCMRVQMHYWATMYINLYTGRNGSLHRGLTQWVHVRKWV